MRLKRPGHGEPAARLLAQGGTMVFRQSLALRLRQGIGEVGKIAESRQQDIGQFPQMPEGVVTQMLRML